MLPIIYTILAFGIIYFGFKSFDNKSYDLITSILSLSIFIVIILMINNNSCSIVDDWVYPNYENATGSFKFNSDKSFNYSSTFFSITRYGTWKKLDDCTYLLTYQNGDTQTVSISNDAFNIGDTRYIKY